MADFQVADGVTVPGPASLPDAVKTNGGDETIDGRPTRPMEIDSSFCGCTTAVVWARFMSRLTAS